jgi:hypothetical protein
LKEKVKLEENQTTATFRLSFIEIYNENVKDLLVTEKEKENRFLNIVEDCKGCTTIAEVTEVTINTIE